MVGEKIARGIDHAIKKGVPFICISKSGGARMMEAGLSLMQMAKTSAALAKLSAKGIPYFSVLTNPTMAGVMASYASLGDVILAEPKALIGFAGRRVIKETTHADLPEGFQTSEFLLEHGLIDQIVPRQEMRDRLITLMDHLGHALEPKDPPPPGKAKAPAKRRKPTKAKASPVRPRKKASSAKKTRG